MEEAVVHTLPIAEEMGMMDDTTNGDQGKEGGGFRNQLSVR